MLLAESEAVGETELYVPSTGRVTWVASDREKITDQNSSHCYGPAATPFSLPPQPVAKRKGPAWHLGFVQHLSTWLPLPRAVQDTSRAKR